jgi:hypothetical protein
LRALPPYTPFPAVDKFREDIILLYNKSYFSVNMSKGREGCSPAFYSPIYPFIFAIWFQRTYRIDLLLKLRYVVLKS